MKKELHIIAHSIRSTHNIGSLLRTADGLGIDHIHFTGYTPYPKQIKDKRLPHLADRAEKQIDKTALGAQNYVNWSQNDNVEEVIEDLRSNRFTIAGLEQSDFSFNLPGFTAPDKLAILIGSEVSGIEKSLLESMDICLEIPMVGKKESYNVIEATTMAMYQCRLVN